MDPRLEHENAHVCIVRAVEALVECSSRLQIPFAVNKKKKNKYISFQQSFIFIYLNVSLVM